MPSSRNYAKAAVEYEELLDTSFNDANQSYKSNVMSRWERKKLQQQQQQQQSQQQLQTLQPTRSSDGNNDNNVTSNNRVPLGTTTNNIQPLMNGDRFIPSRSNMDIAKHQMLKRHHHHHHNNSISSLETPSVAPDAINNDNNNTAPTAGTESESTKQLLHRTVIDDSKNDTYQSNLSSALLGIDDIKNSRVLSYTEKAPAPKGDTINNLNVLYSASLSAGQKKCSTKLVSRHIPSAPSRILDAPDLLDDYYLNLVSWSDTNVLAVALGQTVYLWNATTSAINELCTYDIGINAHISSVKWVREGGTHLAVGVSSGATQLWDVHQCKQVRSMDGHTDRVGSLSWNRHILTSGSRDTTVVNHDVRVAQHNVSQLTTHTQEVCGVCWSNDGETLATGGNDNLLCIWNASNNFVRPRYRLTDHQAAVKAMAWSPHERNLLATGAGTADRSIKFWNTATGSLLNTIDTGSQVCSLLWNPYEKEILSSHGYSRNQLSLWKYPSMQKIKEFEGHTSRVLHMAVSPVDGTVLSAAADETLRFWDIFAAPSSTLVSSSTTTSGSVGNGKMMKGGASTKPSWTMQIR
jgi:cell division cycle 20, cofactor of APC complex